MNDQTRVTLSIDWVSKEICMVHWGLLNTTQFGVTRIHTDKDYVHYFIFFINIIIIFLPIIDMILNYHLA